MSILDLGFNQPASHLPCVSYKASFLFQHLDKKKNKMQINLFFTHNILHILKPERSLSFVFVFQKDTN